MSEIYSCIWCEWSNSLREKDKKIRCERYSQWVDPIATTDCKAFKARKMSERYTTEKGR